ncbi:MAG: tRNA pseudouridine(55) synthase TruB [Cycloclasticus sp.]|nr:tRNA pseudouridine(55) synthase TruB [Cycloclasticus sp.]MBQ0790216.1 tRNA pseudouridine(55) synthase TruB [Cycloclasticus sp.]
MSNRKKKGRDISGILIVDKPLHLSSNQVVQRVKRLFAAKKTGHTGSLDPLATGVLPICLGHGTKVSQYLLASDKSYQFCMRLGETTTTGDSEGDVLLQRDVPALTEQTIDSILHQFCGEVSQVPPMYSALKHQGQRLYALARAGKKVDRPARKVTIKSLELLAQEANSLTLQVVCTKGTYVRTLAEDIGEALGCGAHVTMLRRTHAGPFELSQSVTLEQLEALKGNESELDGLLLRLDVALLDYPVLECNEQQKNDLCMGRKVMIERLEKHSLMRLNDQQGNVFGLGKWSAEGCLAPVRIFA